MQIRFVLITSSFEPVSISTDFQLATTKLPTPSERIAARNNPLSKTKGAREVFAVYCEKTWRGGTLICVSLKVR